MPKTREKVMDSASNVRPYLERAVKDEELRQNLRSAYDSARQVYDDLIGGRGMVALGTRVATDREIQDNLKEAVAELRQASRRIQGKDDHTARNSMLLMIGIALGILFNPATGPATRKWLSDRVFGGGDDFTYQSGDNGA